MSEASVDDLVAAAVAGDHSALTLLLWRHYDQLARRLTPKIPDKLRARVEVEDILQEAFVKAYQQFARYEHHSPAGFTGWLTTIADRQLLDQLKKASAQKRGVVQQQEAAANPQASGVLQLVDLAVASSGTASRAIARDEAAAAIRAGVASLPADQRDAVRLRFFEGRSLDEVAQALGRSPAAVRGLIHRAQKSLANTLGNASQWLSR